MAATAEGFPTNSQFAFQEQSPNAQRIPSKSRSNSLCKTLIILVLLLVIPLFPSQAPDFISESILTKFWEIVHLLFIGIAVAYGLFGRRTPQIAPEKNVDSKIDGSRSYLSGISHLNSFFVDGYNNVCGPDEHDVLHSYANCEFLGKDGCVVHSAKKIRSSASNDGTENILDGNGRNVSQTWSSQYVKGESLVVVSNGKYFVGESSSFKPLNLPVRSLRSSAMDSDKYSNESSPKIEVPKGNDDGEVVKIRGVAPLNLEKTFDEASPRSPIPWRSRSMGMANEEEMSNPKPPAHCRPHSVGEFEFEQHFNSRSLGGLKFSASPEFGRPKKENGKRKRVFKVPKIAPVNVEASLDGSKTQQFNGGAPSNANMLGGLEMDQKKFIDHNDDELGKGKQVVESLEASTDSSGLAKVFSRAKSVRTIKPNRYTMNQNVHFPSQIDGNLLVEKEKGEEHENPQFDHQNKELDRIFTMPKPKPTLPEILNEVKQDIDDKNVRSETEEERERECDKSSDEGGDDRTNMDNDSELYGSEVDRKAGEFIAKFREQIRLQKTSAIEGYSGW